MKAIVNAVIVKPDHYIPEGVVLIENGKIVDFGTKEQVKIPEDAQIIDAGGNFVGPGLIDIHSHGGDDVEFPNGCERACRFHLKGGTTYILPTVYCTFTAEQYVSFVKNFKEMRKSGASQIIGGVYMEGPYLNPGFGSEKKDMIWGGPISAKDYEPLADKIGDFVKVWAISPEREGSEDFVSYVHAKFPDIKFTVAHSEAAPEDIEKLIPYGLCIGTHHTNATGDRPVYPECRGVCVDETVNYRNEISAEIISDRKGVHVAPYMQRLIKKIKGVDKILLITDNCAIHGPVPDDPIYDGATDIGFDYEGEVTGTKMYLANACQNFMKHTGTGICEVFRMASYNQAKLLGLTDRGEIKRGARADILIADGFMNVKKVLLGGQDAEEIIG